MANRYWVGGSGDWDSLSTTNWSASSGGAGGASVPTSADSVFFNANSGGGTVTSSEGGVCASLDFTGFTGDSQNVVQVGGNVTLSTGGTYTLFFAIIIGTCTFTSVGKQISGMIVGDAGVSGTVTLADAFYCGRAGFNGRINLQKGTFNANGFNVTLWGFEMNNNGSSYTPTVNMGSGTWTINDDGQGDPGWYVDGTYSTVNSGTSTINFTGGVTGVGYPPFQGGGKTYYNLNAAGRLTILDSNTFNTFSNTGQPVGYRTILFQRGTTTTVANFSISGTSGALVTLTRSSTATGYTTWSLSKSSGTVSVNYVSLSYSVATGGAAWYAGANSTNGGNNTGWTFTAPPTPIPVAIGPGINFGGGITIG
jgi:hypothetical protein